MCVGFNGKVWIKSERAVDTILIFNSIQRIVDLHMSGDETKSEVDEIIKSLSKKKK
jgi:exosome complex RNA-binding protein Rrp4